MTANIKCIFNNIMQSKLSQISQLSRDIDQILGCYVPEIESGLDRYYEKYYSRVLRKYPLIRYHLYIIGIISILLVLWKWKRLRFRRI